jgi:hypothetical protein
MSKSPQYPFGKPSRARSSKSDAAFAAIRAAAPWNEKAKALRRADEINAELFGLTTDSAARKAIPLATGCLDYFPDALCEVAQVSYEGNKKHNPGQPLHWDKSKSTDEADCLMRHLKDRGTWDAPDMPGGIPQRHSAKVAWRALALLQREIEADRAAGKPAKRKV